MIYDVVAAYFYPALAPQIEFCDGVVNCRWPVCLLLQFAQIQFGFCFSVCLIIAFCCYNNRGILLVRSHVFCFSQRACNESCCRHTLLWPVSWRLRFVPAVAAALRPVLLSYFNVLSLMMIGFLLGSTI